jgi:hypothetical protein
MVFPFSGVVEIVAIPNPALDHYVMVALASVHVGHEKRIPLLSCSIGQSDYGVVSSVDPSQ